MTVADLLTSLLWWFGRLLDVVWTRFVRSWAAA